MPAHVQTAKNLVELIAIAARKSGVSESDATQIGIAAVQLIVEQHGGRRLYIPAHEMARRARRQAMEADIRANVDIDRLRRKYGVSRGRLLRVKSSLS